MSEINRKTISVDEAIAHLPDGETVHTFRNPRGVLIEAAWDKNTLIEALKEADEIEVTGPAAQAMNHGIAIMNMGSLLFVETKIEPKVKCVWCDDEFNPLEMAESRFLGGQVCPQCDADEPRKTLGDIHDRLKDRSKKYVDEGAGWVK